MSTAHRGRTVAIVAASVVASVSLTLAGSALATPGHQHHRHAHAVPAPPAHPTSDRQIQNIGQVAGAIKAYYGDRTTDTDDPVTTDGKVVKLHTFAHQGAYARQMRHIAKRARAYLSWQKKHLRGHLHGKKRAIVLDVDDTTLNTYNYEIYANFGYSPTDNAAFVNGQLFPAVPGMVRLVKAAQQKGYAVFYLTGRPTSQFDGTKGNLAKDGYPAVADNHFYLKDLDASWLSSCNQSCTTTQFKSLTRKHIQRQGYRIVANVGDQFSDLKGGHANKRFKLPNPMYYLP